MLAARAPDVVCANTVANDYLLGGLIFCARCGGLFIGHNARSGAYRYYACQSKKKLGGGRLSTHDAAGEPTGDEPPPRRGTARAEGKRSVQMV